MFFGYTAYFLLESIQFCRLDYFRDASNFYLQSLVMANKGLPFLDFVDNKNPGIFYLLYPFARLFSWNTFYANFFFIILGALNIYLLIKLAYKFIENKKARKLVILLVFSIYLAFTLSAGAFYVMPQVPQLTFTLLSFIFFLDNRGFLAGVSVALAFMFRQSALADFAMLFMYSTLLCLKNRRELKRLALYLWGFAIVFAFFLLLAHFQGWLNDLVIYAYKYNGLFAAKENIAAMFVNFLKMMSQTPGIVFYPLILLTSLPVIIANTKNKGKILFLIILILSSFLEIALYSLWSIHHFLQIFPMLILISAFSLEFAFSSPRKIVSLAIFSAHLLLILINLFAITDSFIQKAENFKKMPDEQIIGRYIEENSDPSDKILVWGFDDHLYIYAQRYPASRFHMNYQLTGQNEMIEPFEKSLADFSSDISKTKPEYIVVADKYCFENRCSDIEKYFTSFSSKYTRISIQQNLEKPEQFRIFKRISL